MEAQWEEAANMAFRGKACVAGGISQGTTGRRQEVKPKSEVEVKQMVEDASAARQLLADVRMKAIMEPMVKTEAWYVTNGRGVPNMYME